MNLETQSAASEIASTGAFQLSRVAPGDSETECLQLALRFPSVPEQNPSVSGCPELPAIQRIISGEFPVIELQDFAGASLASIFAGRKFTAEFSYAILRSIARALDQLHAAGRIHGALSPWSILVGENAQVRIVDWMILWQNLPLRDRAHAAEYLAPEIFAQAAADAGPDRFDQFALGVIAFQLLAGATPFPGAGLAESLFRIRYGIPDLDPGGEIHFAAQVIFHRVFSVDPAERFDSCSAFVQQLEQATPLRNDSETRLDYAESDRWEDRTPTAGAGHENAAAGLQSRAQKSGLRWWTTAIVLSLLATGLGITDWFLQSRIGQLTRQEALVESSQPAGTLASGVFRVCNASPESMTVSELAVAYWGPEHRLRVFSSSSYTHSGWPIAPASSRNLSWPSGEKSIWDGSVLFYFLRIQKGDKEFIVTGRWDAVGQGCLHV